MRETVVETNDCFILLYHSLPFLSTEKSPFSGDFTGNIRIIYFFRDNSGHNDRIRNKDPSGNKRGNGIPDRPPHQ